MSSETAQQENQTPPIKQPGWVSWVSSLYLLLLMNNWDFVSVVLTEERNRCLLIEERNRCLLA